MDITDLNALPGLEWERRRAKFEQIWGAFSDDAVAVEEWQGTDIARTQREAEALEYLEALGTSQDLKAFARSLEPWGHLPGHSWFSGMTMMFVNQLVNLAEDNPGQVAALLYRVLSAPSDEAEARVRMQDLIDHVLTIQVGGQPAAGRVATLCSFFWSMKDHDNWPVFWPSAADGLGALGWLPRDGGADSFVHRYLLFRVIVGKMGRVPKEVEKAFSYLKSHPFVGLDPSLAVRLKEATALRSQWNQKKGAYADATSELQAELHARAINGDVLLLAQGLKDPLSQALGHPLKVSKPYPKTSWGKAAPFKTEGLVTLLSEEGGRGPAIRIEATDKGMAVGMTPGWPPDSTPKGYAKEIANALEVALPEDLQFIKVAEATVASRIEPAGRSAPDGLPFIARWYTWPEAQRRGGTLIDDTSEVGESIARPFAESIAISKGVPNVAPANGARKGELPIDAVDYLQSAADELLFERSVLAEWQALLEDKRQLIFYGPPGTGKTFIAKRLAKALVDEDRARYELTQLHPSSSYEDFFEGYRPETVGDTLVYTLKPGPLARMATVAGQTQSPVVLVVDEINRANIPRVFGELLFLLEYRDEAIPTLYRESFALPENLRIIGTMNTADRSIALVDAALRRRFHFVPLFPDQDPIADLLPAYLDEYQPSMAWAAGLVSAVNEELVEHLGHRDFQIGPSHFMKKDLDDDKLRRIWDHSVFPLIEEQFYSDPDRVKRYRFDVVKLRLGKAGDPSPPGNDIAEIDERPAEEATGA